jgi:hypothetical protein
MQKLFNVFAPSSKSTSPTEQDPPNSLRDDIPPYVFSKREIFELKEEGIFHKDILALGGACDQLTTLGPGVFSLALLSPQFCDLLLTELISFCKHWIYKLVLRITLLTFRRIIME